MDKTTTVNTRQTKYQPAVLEAIGIFKHATNNQIYDFVRQIYPDVSITTIHRITTRLKGRGVIGSAPKTSSSEERYDINAKPHHHFMCMKCDRLCDVAETKESRAAIELLGSLSRRCKFADIATLQGTCDVCDDRVSSEQNIESILN